MQKVFRYISSLFFICSFMLLTYNLRAQQLKLGTNPTQIKKSAVLELESDRQGLLLTRISSFVEIDDLKPPDGMIVYYEATMDQDSTGLYIHKDGVWKRLVAEDEDKEGIVSINGDTAKAQKLTVSSDQTKPIGFESPPLAAGKQILNIPDASDTYRGVVNTTGQSFKGIKTFLSSPHISTLHPGSVVFIGDNDSLSENNDEFYWDKINNRLGVGNKAPNNTVEITGNEDESGLTFTNLKADPGTTKLIGVDDGGRVVRTGVQRTITYPTRHFNTAYQISSTEDAFVNYSITITISSGPLGIGGVPNAGVKLEVSPNKAGPWETIISQVGLSQAGLLGAVSLGKSLSSTMVLSGWIPKNYWVRLTTSSIEATEINSAQEVKIE